MPTSGGDLTLLTPATSRRLGNRASHGDGILQSRPKQLKHAPPPFKGRKRHYEQNTAAAQSRNAEYVHDARFPFTGNQLL